MGYSAQQHIQIAILPSKQKKKTSQMNSKKCSFKSVDLNFFRYAEIIISVILSTAMRATKNNDQPLNRMNLTLHHFFHCHKNLDTPMFALLAHKPCILMCMQTYANTRKHGSNLNIYHYIVKLIHVKMNARVRNDNE